MGVQARAFAQAHYGEGAMQQTAQPLLTAPRANACHKPFYGSLLTSCCPPNRLGSANRFFFET